MPDDQLRAAVEATRLAAKEDHDVPFPRLDCGTKLNVVLNYGTIISMIECEPSAFKHWLTQP